MVEVSAADNHRAAVAGGMAFLVRVLGPEAERSEHALDGCDLVWYPGGRRRRWTLSRVVVAARWCNVTGIVGGERGCTGLTAAGQRQAALLAGPGWRAARW